MGATTAELLKLRKRPATWVLAAILAVFLVLFGYLLTYVFATSDTLAEGIDTAGLIDSLLPAEVPAATLNLIAGFGGALALIFGALAMGSEYGWRAVKTMATQRPGRTALLLGKVAAVVLLLAIMVVLLLVVALVSSAGVAALEQASGAWPAAGELAAAFGAGLLIMATWASLGLLLAVAVRGTGLAIGLGLVYALVVETLAVSLPFENALLDAIRAVLVGHNANALVQRFGGATAGFSGPPPGLPDPAQAALVLVIEAVVFVVLAWTLFRQREIT